MPKFSSKAAEVMRAGEYAQKMGRKVSEARKTLDKAEKARDRADARYLALVRESLPSLQRAPEAATEVQHAS